MQVAPTADQELFRDAARRVIAAGSTNSHVRSMIDDPVGFDRELWKRGGELGWYAALVPEEYGGGSVSGAGVLDLALIAEEFGRTLQPGPFHLTNIVADPVAHFGSAEQRADLLPPLASGELNATWAFAEPDQDWSAAAVSLSGTPDGDGFVLNGVKTCVQDAHVADHLLVTALAPPGLTQFVIAANTPGVQVVPLRSMDVARRLSEVRFVNARVSASAALGDVGRAGAAVERQLQVAVVLQCAESNGATAQAFETTVEYAKQRVAFGRPIGSFQALEHRMATHRMWFEGGFAATAYAASA